MVFVGMCPSAVSLAAGHYYAAPRCAFWTVLHQAGFTERVLEPAEDALLLRYGLGLTDVFKRFQPADDFEAPRVRFQPGGEGLEERLRPCAPKLVCFTGKNAYRACFGHKAAAYGLQPERIGPAAVFVAPSPAARVASRRRLEGKTRLEWYRDLLTLAG